MKKIVVLIGIVLGFIIIGLGINRVFNNNITKDELKFKEEYESINNKTWESNGYQGEYLRINIPKNNLMRYVDDKEIVCLLTKGTQVIYFGNAYCNWCRSAVTVLIDSAKEYNLGQIYYYDFFNLRDAYEEGTNQELVSIYDDVIKEMDAFIERTFDKDSKVAGKKRLSAPMVVIVSSGKVVDVHYKTVDSHVDYNSNLNSPQKKELKDIYLDMFNKLVYACGDDC